MSLKKSDKMNQQTKRTEQNDRFAKYVGMELIEARDGYAVTQLDIKDFHFNGLDRVHGGVIFTLADYAFGEASNSEGFSTVGLNVGITYFKSPSGTFIRAIAEEISAQNKICGYQVRVLDKDGSLLALFNGLGYRKRLETL